MRTPFDSLTLAAVLSDLRLWEGARVQKIVQSDQFSVWLELHSSSQGTRFLFLSCHPVFARMHLASRRGATPVEVPGFCAALRARIGGGSLRKVEQVGFDRIAKLTFESDEGFHVLIAELMGKHSNLILVDEAGKIVSSAKAVTASMSKRPVVSGRTYLPPPFEPRGSLLDASSGDPLKGLEGASPYLLNAIALGLDLDRVREAVRKANFEPVMTQDGPYPIPPLPDDWRAEVEDPAYQGEGNQVGRREVRGSISELLESWYSRLEADYRTEQARSSLVAQLERVMLAREVALQDLERVREAGAGASSAQMKGELILAYGYALSEGASVLEAIDYEGNSIVIKLDPLLDFKENAQSYFDRAKRAKRGARHVDEQQRRFSDELGELRIVLSSVRQSDRLDDLIKLREAARSKKWLFEQTVVAAKKEDRPFEGHRIRDLLGPQGYHVLYGENATSNDYLTLRIAKPDDWWLHVRGGVSAHVIIQTGKQPLKVARETIEWAARICVQNSPSKHSGFVSVDYTLKKYVRKLRGAPAGTAFYTHEKTLHVES